MGTALTISEYKNIFFIKSREDQVLCQKNQQHADAHYGLAYIMWNIMSGD